MSELIVKLKDHYLVWSKISDGPLTNGLSLDELRIWVRDELGTRGLEQLEKNLPRIDQVGTSRKADRGVADTIWLNYAGPDSESMTVEGIYRHYCLGEDMRDEWVIPVEVVQAEDGQWHKLAVAGWENGK